MALKPLSVTPYATPQGAADITFCGDLYFGEFYQEYAKTKNLHHALDLYGYDGCGQDLKEFLNTSHFVVANLETSLTNREQPTHLSKKQFSFKADAAKTIAAIKKLPIHAVSLANNHTMDFGADGLLDTVNALRDENIPYFGAGRNLSEARGALLKEVIVGAHTFKLAIISCFELIDGYQKHMKFYADDKTAGTCGVDLKFLRDYIADLKSKGYYVIVQPHWEGNFSYPTYQQVRVAHSLLGACEANLIIGHGAHFFSDVHYTNKGWVIFSLGDFIFNSWGEYKNYRVPSYSAIVRFVLTPNSEGVKKSLHIYPIQSENTLTEFQPRFVNEGEFEHFCMTLFYKQNDPNFMRESLTCHTDGTRYFLRLDLDKEVRRFI